MTEIINMSSKTFQLLKSISDIKQVASNYPDSFAVYPTAICQTSHKAHFVNNHMQEMQTEWTITVDLFVDYGSLTDITNKLISLFSAMGFLNDTASQDLAGITRTVIRFTGIVDNELGRVYQKG